MFRNGFYYSDDFVDAKETNFVAVDFGMNEKNKYLYAICPVYNHICHRHTRQTIMLDKV